MTPHRLLRHAALLFWLAVAVLALGPPAVAEAPVRQSDATTSGQVVGEAQASARHTVELPGRRLEFTAVAGRVGVRGPSGAPDIGDVGYIAYLREGVDPASRPLVVAINGGPGAASAWLNIGGLGPWRLPIALTGGTITGTGQLIPNAETWLDFADLVFLDPTGTGYSRLETDDEEGRRRVWSVDGDIRTLSTAIIEVAERLRRAASPRIIVGESYAGFRAPLLAKALQSTPGGPPAGLILVSPVLDFRWLWGPQHDPMGYAGRLPSFIAAMRELKGPVDRAALDDVEQYAAGEFVVDLLRGPSNRAAVARIAARIAALSGLDEDTVRQSFGRLDNTVMLREIARARGMPVSVFDASVGGREGGHRDPFLGPLGEPLTEAMTELVERRIGWRPGRPYVLFSSNVNRLWSWGREGRRGNNVVSTLSEIVLLNEQVPEILVVHGLTDLQTPYFLTRLLLDQVSVSAPSRIVPGIAFEAYPGGHMFYVRDGSRIAFRTTAERMIERARERRLARPVP